MEILIGLAIATVAAIGWFYGNLFVCVFLSLGTVLAGGFVAMIGGGNLVLAFPVLLIAIWVPRLCRQGRFMSAN